MSETLREFFKAVQAGKDAEPSWKKAIYKIIARLDEPVPEYFRTPNFLEHLEWKTKQQIAIQDKQMNEEEEE